jgi:uncharacterized membrane protein
MSDPIRVPLWAWLALVALAAGMFALAWWDWAYPGLVWMWWQGERVYPFFWRQLRWALALSGGVCLGLWGLGALLAPRRGGRFASSLSPAARAALPFALSLAVLPFFTRYTFHPLGVQPGSSVWTYGLVLVTAAVLAVPLAQVARLAGAMVTRLLGASGARQRGLIGVCALAALYAIIFGALCMARHTSFRSHALDMGAMDQAAWNTSRGRLLERTPLYRAPAAGSRYENRLLDAKLELALFPLSALYWLWADPRVLLAVQTAFLASGAIALYRLAVERIPSGPGRAEAGGQGEALLPALLLAAAYLLYLPLQYVHMADFHSSALAVPLLIAAWRAMRRKEWKRYTLWLALAMGCRIDAVLTALALGGVVLLWRGVARRERDATRHGLYTVALAVAWLVVNFGVVVPLVRRLYGPGAGDLVSRRFGAWGNGPLEIARTVIAHPGLVFARLASRDKLQVLFDLLAPAGFVPLLAPLALLPALPVLAINLLADSPWQQSIHAHYMAPVIPFFWIAAVEGIAWVARARAARGRRVRGADTLATFALLCALGVSLVLSPFPPGVDFSLANYWQPSPHSADIASVLALVPEGASVCAQSDLHPHLSQRRDACLFPYCGLEGDREAEYVVLDLDATSTKSPLGFHAFYQMVDLWLTREDYGVLSQRGGVLLLQRRAAREDLPEVLAALDAYGRDLYQVEYLRAALSPVLEANDLIRVPVTLRNAGSQAWHSRGQLPVRLSYRWWTTAGSLLLFDPLRTNLPHRVEPGQEVDLRAWVRTPTEPGRYILEWDMVREGDAWFGERGAEMLRQVVSVR